MSKIDTDWIGAARSAVAVTPSDTTVLLPTRGLYVGVAGNVAVALVDDPEMAVTFVGAAAGVVLPLRVVKVMATNTTASSIVALY